MSLSGANLVPLLAAGGSVADPHPVIKVNTPGFLEYVFKYALPILLPILGLVALLFFSRWRVL